MNEYYKSFELKLNIVFIQIELFMKFQE